MKIIESPREGMQGYDKLIPTDQKIRYLNALLRAGFDTVEVGSIVSPRVIPQMSDSMEVLAKLNLSGTRSNLMFLALNRKGADLLSRAEAVTHISYPFSFSPTFLAHNTRSTVEDSFETAAYVVNLSEKSSKTAVIYISYAYGNPYGDMWNMDLLQKWIEKLGDAGARIIPLSNVSIEISSGTIREVYSRLVSSFPDIEFGLHLHTANHDWHPKLQSAFDAGVRRFDAVIDGHGGCPMTGKEMLGNLMTQNLLSFMKSRGIPSGLDKQSFEEAVTIAGEIYNE
jgi:hydroxymethylglutaryl-CoA lyase